MEKAVSAISVLVLGSSGMLGSQVFATLRNNASLRVDATARKSGDAAHILNAEAFLREPSRFDFLKKYSFIVNCIGVIKPHCRDTDPEGALSAISVNGLFPRVLANFLKNSESRVIQIATDCVFSGQSGFYSEQAPHDALDVYGKSKSLGEVDDPRFLHIRSSIIGREVSSQLSLLDWFLSRPEGTTVQGFDHHIWNGVTTLQFSELCEKIITLGVFDQLRAKSSCHHFIPNEAVTKFQLLGMFQEVFGKNVQIRRVSETGAGINRALSSNLPHLSEIFPNSKLRTEIERIRK
jgi:dTDP-4-dehydrorhamnose reductase